MRRLAPCESPEGGYYGHRARAQTSQLYDRRQDATLLDEVKQMLILSARKDCNPQLFVHYVSGRSLIQLVSSLSHIRFQHVGFTNVIYDPAAFSFLRAEIAGLGRLLFA